MTAPHRTAEHTIYRIYDASGVLLYLGCTVNVEQRLKAHRRKPWWPQVARVTTEGPFPGVIAGQSAEDAYIDAEKPLYALNRRQVGERAAAATHRVGPDGLTPLTAHYARRRARREAGLV